MIWLAAVILCLCFLTGKKETFFKIVLRALVGSMAVFTINMALDMWGIPSYVGLNMVTLLVCGVLGVPGILGLYGLSFYQLFY